MVDSELTNLHPVLLLTDGPDHNPFLLAERRGQDLTHGRL